MGSYSSCRRSSQALNSRPSYSQSNAVRIVYCVVILVLYACLLPAAESITATIQRHNQVFTEGETIRLICNADGSPSPVVAWQRRGEYLVSGGKIQINGDELIIRSASVEDSGLYKCVARNDQGRAEDSTSIQVKFQGKGRAPQPNDPPAFLNP